MTPSHLLRATMPLRPLTLRPILPTTQMRSISIQTQGTETQAPSRLRNYASALKTGTVVSVGRMDRTVRVLHRHTQWDNHIRKYYPQETQFLVSDPANSLRDGDVIEFSSGAPKSKHVRHVVERIVTPFGENIADRPAVLSKGEREALREDRWAAKYIRRESRRLGREVSLVEEAEKVGVSVEGLSDAQVIHKIHGENERVGRIKRIVQERVEGAKVAEVDVEEQLFAELEVEGENLEEEEVDEVKVDEVKVEEKVEETIEKKVDSI